VSSSIIVRRIRSKEALARAFAIRMRVFVKEQRVPSDIEIDEEDGHAIHFLACYGDHPAGTARVVLDEEGVRIGRMAVLKRYRGRGVGKELLKCAVDAARRIASRNKGKRESGKRDSARHASIYLHAQVPVIGFYKLMGFRCVGPVFTEAGIPHRKMVLQRRR
jgi:predicted GNAT family N-acyltransferase